MADNSEKVTISLKKNVLEKVQKIYEHAKDSYERLNLDNIEAFVNYILESFCSSSLQFEKMTDQWKDLIENINLENLNYEDLFKNIVKSSIGKKDAETTKSSEDKSSANQAIDKKKEENLN